jgi:hypothetical protein
MRPSGPGVCYAGPARPPTAEIRLGDQLLNGSVVTPDLVTASAADYLAVYGDLRQADLVADRVGTTIELVPHLFGVNRRPTGQREVGGCTAGSAATWSTLWLRGC